MEVSGGYFLRRPARRPALPRLGLGALGQCKFRAFFRISARVFSHL